MIIIFSLFFFMDLFLTPASDWIIGKNENRNHAGGRNERKDHKTHLIQPLTPHHPQLSRPQILSHRFYPPHPLSHNLNFHPALFSLKSSLTLPSLLKKCPPQSPPSTQPTWKQKQKSSPPANSANRKTNTN